MKLLNNAETAELLGLKPNTLEIWRIQGRGPVFRKIGRAVRYVEPTFSHGSTRKRATAPANTTAGSAAI